MYRIIENYILNLLVLLPAYENRIRSYRLGEEDIKAMSKKGYTVFDADKQRFVKPSKEFLKSLQKRRL
jgi:hypothetical protein